MKALLLKDVYTLKESRALLVVIVVIAVFMAVWGGADNASFIISYVMVLCAVIAVNTMNYDETDNGYAFLMTMPFSRKTYVMEKYLFGFAAGLLGWIFALAMGALAGRFSGGAELDSEISWWPLYGGTLGAFFVLLTVMIPVQLKFGGNKGKIAMLASMAIVAGAAAAMVKTGGIQKLGQILVGATMIQLTLVSIIVVAACLVASFLCSVRIMERKEF